MCRCHRPRPLLLPPQSWAGVRGGRAQFGTDAMLSFSDSPGPPKGEKGEERDKAKKEKGLDSSDWKPETGLSPPRKKRGEEPKDRYFFWEGEKGATLVMSSASGSVSITSFYPHAWGGATGLSSAGTPPL